MKISYELHSEVKGRWNIERTYLGNEKNIALEDAKRLNSESHVSAVKLIRESFNEATNQSNEVVIFDTTKSGGGESAKPVPAPAKPAPEKPEAKSSAPMSQRRRPSGKKKDDTSMTKLAVLVVLAVAVIAVLLVLLNASKDILDRMG
ncbi:MAG: hypothetical protein QF926_10590 [Alphaproteobacteria bacterium]|jgi:hypothetical protein|nr:hypothetical protein [Alphaproteobacteria bacterium]MDP6517054.1 hypothetical protein [Alphaproteobacteria bacterium]